MYLVIQIKAKDQRFTAAAYEMIAEDVCCDSVRLNQVLINLLGNAVKFTPEKGSVQVSVYQEALPEDTFCVRTHFLVSDTGIGMSQEYQKVIFDSFRGPEMVPEAPASRAAASIPLWSQEARSRKGASVPASDRHVPGVSEGDL